MKFSYVALTILTLHLLLLAKNNAMEPQKVETKQVTDFFESLNNAIWDQDSEEVSQTFDAIENAGTDLLNQVFVVKHEDGNSLLHITLSRAACPDNTEEMVAIVNQFFAHLEKTQPKTIRNVFCNQDKNENTPLYLVASCFNTKHPEITTTILLFAEKFEQLGLKDFFYELLTLPNQEGRTALERFDGNTSAAANRRSKIPQVTKYLRDQLNSIFNSHVLTSLLPAELITMTIELTY